MRQRNVSVALLTAVALTLAFGLVAYTTPANAFVDRCSYECVGDCLADMCCNELVNPDCKGSLTKCPREIVCYENVYYPSCCWGIVP